ncbi:MAG TPA: thiamine phosphate synthase [Pyrinomonadaceae bacterium]|nr:thiamine phosphate synthase [Pyrinomonadaceae bacterium]
MSLPVTRPLLYLITRGEAGPANFSQKKKEILDIVRAAVDAGVNLIQIREKDLEGRQLFEIVLAAVEIAAGSKTLILASERFDVAIAAGAHGVHLPARALASATVRKIVPGGFLIGVSTHNAGEIESAVSGEADFVTFGPIFDSSGKGPPVELDELSKICKQFPDLPVIALGGINETNLNATIDAGAAGIAAIRLLNDPVTLAEIAARVKQHNFR